MSNLAKNEIFVPRSNLQRTLVYHPNVKWGYRLASVLSVLIYLPPLMDAHELYSKGNEMGALVLLLAGALMPIFFFHFSRSTLKPLVAMKVHVHPDSLKVEKPEDAAEISFQEIESITLSYFPYLAGWFKIHLRNGESYKFTVALQRSEYILEAVMNYNPKLFSRDKFESYRRTAVSAEHSGSRFVGLVKNWKSLGIRYVALPLVGALIWSGPKLLASQVISWKSLSDSAAMLFFFNLFLGQALWIVSEFLIVRRTRAILRESPSAVVRDVVFETNLMKRSARFHALIFGFFASLPTLAELSLVLLRFLKP